MNQQFKLHWHTCLEYGASTINFITIIIENCVHAMQCVEGISPPLYKPPSTHAKIRDWQPANP